jgi:hypothetical protein
VFFRLGEHISCFKAVCIAWPRHQPSQTASARPR